MVALCLNQQGLQRVRESHALNVLITIASSKRYMKALALDAPGVLGAGLEELFRFVPVLRPEGVGTVIAVLRALCILGGTRRNVSAQALCLDGQCVPALLGRLGVMHTSPLEHV
jgi:hypothetical protein